ncbi:hypothetical protein E2C01_082048 [Portunus trituberculatus]|uniref:Uncharacterized protein n=1 Tax=Portunus trituberculatus TaxID=210409 RepID=A0A5B7ITH8_PORTR|nr:hypothetical protein [Portunus trituberculatus]
MQYLLLINTNHNTPHSSRHFAGSKLSANQADTPATPERTLREKEKGKGEKENPKIKKRERGVVALEKMEQGGLTGSSPLTQTTPNTT